MTLRHFSVFLSVYDLRGMTRAGEALNLTQSAVSRTIGELEAFYGVRLFERLGKQVYPTENAHELEPYIRHLLGLYSEVEEGLRLMSQRRTLRLGASVTIGGSLLSPLVSRYRSAHPDCTVTAVVDNTETLEHMLLKNEIDLGLIEGKVHAPELETSVFMEDELVVIMGKNHPLSGKRTITLDEFLEKPLVVREEGSGTRELLETALLSLSLPFRAAWVCNNAEAIKSAVIAGEGLSVLSPLSLVSELASGQIRVAHIEGLSLRRSFLLVRHRNKYLTESLREFMELCRLAGFTGM